MPFREGQMIRVGGPRGLHAVMVDRVETGAVATKLGIRRGDWGWVAVQWRVRDSCTGLSRMRNDDGWRRLRSDERGLRRVSDGGVESQLWNDEG